MRPGLAGRVAISLAAIVLSLVSWNSLPGETTARAQQPTGTIPTVTGTPPGPMVSVDPSLEMVRVYAGPSQYSYPAVGVLLTGVRVGAIARAAGNDNWIQIEYPGAVGGKAWIYGLWVQFINPQGLVLPVVAVPATPTPAATPTIDPTLAALYAPQTVAPRLPTFTPAPALGNVVADKQDTGGSTLPVGLVLVVLVILGSVGAAFSFVQTRR